MCVTRWVAVPGLGWGQTAGRALGHCSELSQHRRARDTGPRECQARREALGAQQHAAPADTLGFARWPRRRKRAQQGRLTRVQAKWGGGRSRTASLGGNSGKSHQGHRPPRPGPWGSEGQRCWDLESRVGCPGRGPRKERGPCWGPGALCTLAGREPEDQHRTLPSCPPPKVPRRDQVEASGRRNTRSYWAPWGGPQDADPAEGRPGAQAPGEAVARSPACGHWTVQTPFCRRLHKWGELERSRGQVPCFLRAASAPRTQTGVTEERSLRM